MVDELTQSQLLRWIPLLPLLAAAVHGVLLAVVRRSLPRGLVILLSCGAVIGSFVLSFVALIELVGVEGERILVDNVYTWIGAGRFSAEVAYLLDPLSAAMSLTVTGVGSLIHVYSIGYMDEDHREDKGFQRFFCYLNLFMFAMLTLVLGDNLLLMFLGWEGVGLCSYLLIGFWYADRFNAYCGAKAFIVNRIGDFGFLVGIFLLFWSLADAGQAAVAFRDIEAGLAAIVERTVVLPDWLGFLPGAPEWRLTTLIGICLFVGAMGKSAQIPLYVWLPDAMAGPTPVSALIHAATMVTAGVYMVCRMSFLYAEAPGASALVAWTGAITAIFAATIAIAQTDIKKVLAYSTVSQLGYMFLACGVGAYTAAIFHLMTHAFFKGLLFLGSGSVIHGMGGEQDVRKMGGLAKLMPITTLTFLVATLAISGIPPFAGFFSKDEILFAASGVSPALWGVGATAAAITAFYMFRLFFLTFTGGFRGDDETRHHVHESPAVMWVPLAILAVLSFAGGMIGWPDALGGSLLGGNHFHHFLAPVLGGHAAEAAIAPERSEAVMAGVSVGIALAGITLAWMVYVKAKGLLPMLLAAKSRGFAAMMRTVTNKYYVDALYDRAIVRPLHALSDTLLYRVVDVGIIDGLVNGVAAFVEGTGRNVIRRLQTGVVQTYALAMTAGMVAVILYIALR